MIFGLEWCAAQGLSAPVLNPTGCVCPSRWAWLVEEHRESGGQKVGRRREGLRPRARHWGSMLWPQIEAEVMAEQGSLPGLWPGHEAPAEKHQGGLTAAEGTVLQGAVLEGSSDGSMASPRLPQAFRAVSAWYRAPQSTPAVETPEEWDWGTHVHSKAVGR